ncbi:MAG: ABC transporter substrate-binding protein, partial [Thermoprotei archaeon]
MAKPINKWISIVAVVLVIIVVASAIEYRELSNQSQQKQFTLGPQNTNTLIDIGTEGVITTPDALDPATGFYGVDGSAFAAVYQGLLTYNGSSITQLVPVLAKSWVMEPNGSTYVFIMRPNTYFSNGDPINATTAWFSFYRTILMAQGPGVSNYEGIIAQFKGPYFLPVGASHAVQYAFHLSSLPSPNQTAAILSQVLSNFNAHNSTIEALMSYRNQSVVMLNSSAVEFNLLEPYSWFTYDISSGWWGDFADPAFVDAHGGVQAGQANSYINTNGMVGSGP